MTTMTGRRLTPEAVRLLMTSRAALREAERATTPAERYAAAHLAALRAAAAVLAARARPLDKRSPRSRRPTSAWALWTKVAPELAEWAAYFAAGADKRAAAEAGLRHAATAREADDLLPAAATSPARVEPTVGALRTAHLEGAG